MINQMHSALVTGASGGIGIEICKLLVERGLSVVAVARDRSRLEQAIGSMAGVCAVPCDLTSDRDVEQLMARCPRVDILVNCAGVMSVGPMSERDWQELNREIMLNTGVVVRLCHHYGAAMIAAGQGRILNFASTAAARRHRCLPPMLPARRSYCICRSRWRQNGALRASA